MLYDYFVDFNIIEYEDVETDFDLQGYPPRKPILGKAIKGWFQPNSSDEAMIASAQGVKTTGFFFTLPGTSVKDGSLIVETSSKMPVRIIGDDLARLSLQSSEPHRKFVAQSVSWEEIGGEL